MASGGQGQVSQLEIRIRLSPISISRCCMAFLKSSRKWYAPTAPDGPRETRSERDAVRERRGPRETRSRLCEMHHTPFSNQPEGTRRRLGGCRPA
jgi:hypothetical protein